jgi:glutamine cyclotransferase
MRKSLTVLKGLTGLTGLVRFMGLTGLTAVLMMSCSDPVKSDPVVVIPEDSTDVPPIVIPEDTANTDAIRIAVTTIAADYTAANFEIISTDNYSVRQDLIPGLHTDNAVRTNGGDVYILERFGKDNVVKYNTREMAVEYQEHLGEGLNIQDIAFASETKAYISCYESADLIVFNPNTGRKVSTIDLSRFNAYAETDSAEAYPYASALAVYGDYLYVACQRLNSLFEPADTSLIAVIDIRTDAIVTSIKLNKKNPASMDVFGDKLLVSSSGDWSDATAASSGIEMINLANNENLGLIADGGAFGGSLGNVIFISSNKAYAAAMTANWTTDIIEFNPATKTVGAKINGISDGSGGLAYDGSTLYVGDRGFGAAGVVAVNPSTNAAERTISTGMPPSGVAIIKNLSFSTHLSRHILY